MRHHPRRVFSLVLLVLALAGRELHGQIKRIAVSFTLMDRSYADRYTDSVKARVERTVGALLRTRLVDTGHLHFVEFAEGQSVFDTLRFGLDRHDRSSAAEIGAVGIWALVMPPDGSEREIYWATFRGDNTASAPIGGADALIRNLDVLFQGLKPVEYQRLSDSLLSHVPIANHAVLHPQPLGWIIPYRHADLCLDKTSEMDVHNVITEGEVTTFEVVRVVAKSTIREQVLGRPTRELSLPDPSSVDARAVYMTKYRYDRAVCRKQAPPAEETFRAGSSQ